MSSNVPKLSNHSKEEGSNRMMTNCAATGSKVKGEFSLKIPLQGQEGKCYFWHEGMEDRTRGGGKSIQKLGLRNKEGNNQEYFVV